MQFQHPWFLLVAFSALIPIYLHLRARASRGDVAFPSIQWFESPPLQRIPRALIETALLATRLAIVAICTLLLADPRIEIDPQIPQTLSDTSRHPFIEREMHRLMGVTAAKTDSVEAFTSDVVPPLPTGLQPSLLSAPSDGIVEIASNGGPQPRLRGVASLERIGLALLALMTIVERLLFFRLARRSE